MRFLILWLDNDRAGGVREKANKQLSNRARARKRAIARIKRLEKIEEGWTL